MTQSWQHQGTTGLAAVGAVERRLYGIASGPLEEIAIKVALYPTT